jgi:hypothetical protein
MRARSLAVAVVTLVGFSGCGSDTTAVMPDVTGKKLDVAKSTIRNAGFEDEVKVDGGGAFGVLNESNWEVCDQSPSAGAAVSGAPRLTIDRSCHDDAAPGETSKPSTTASEPAAADGAPSSGPDADQVLTKSNSEKLAALLGASDYCDESIASFAAGNGGRTIEFDGSIANMANHGDYKTRYDILVAPGNEGPESKVGAAFKFEDVNVFDLHLTGAKIPDYVGNGDRFRFVAQIVKYDHAQCLLFLQPVATRAR